MVGRGGVRGRCLFWLGGLPGGWWLVVVGVGEELLVYRGGCGAGWYAGAADQVERVEWQHWWFVEGDQLSGVEVFLA